MQQNIIIGLAKNPFSFLFKIKDTLFIFTNNLIELDSLGMSAVSRVVQRVDCFQFLSRFDHYQLQLVSLTMEHHLARNLQHKTSQNTFDTFSHSTFSTHCTNLFMRFSCIFTFLEIISVNAENVVHFLPSSILKWLHKNSPIWIS